MKYKHSHFPTQPIKIFKTNNEYCVELGTYLPIAKRVEELKKAGTDLMAYRQAYAEFANGTQNIDLDNYDNELLNADEIDFLELKKRYFDIMKKQAKIAQEVKEKQEKEAQEKAFNAEVEKRLKNSQKEPEKS